MVENGEKLKQVKYWLKFHVVLLNREIYRRFTKNQLLEARNPSNPAVVEIDGVVSFGKLKEVTVRLS
jgi:hypothetical protein